MNVDLTDTLNTYVQQQIASGVYRDQNDVIAEALRLKMRLEDRHPQSRAESLYQQQAYVDAMAHCDGDQGSLIDEYRCEVGG